MNRRYLTALTYTLCVTLLATGCQPQKTVYFHEGKNLTEYLDRATQVDYPDIRATSLEEVNQNDHPVTLRNPEFGDFWDLGLEDCVAIALQNSKIIRGYGTPGLSGNIVAPGADSLANNPAGAGTTYNVAIRESEPGFLATPGQHSPASNIGTNTSVDSGQGVEAALAEFDAHFLSSISWDKTDRPTNTVTNAFTANFNPAQQQTDGVNFQAQLSKKAATGTQFFLRNINRYDANNFPAFYPGGNAGAFQAFDAFWTASIEAEARQPLLRGRGTYINRIPVIVARIGTDQEIASLEAQLQNMLCNVEIRYWNLHCAYRAYEAAKQGEDSALATWSQVNERMKVGKGKPNEEAQTREQYFSFRSAKNQALADLMDAESNLRWLMGIANSDKRMLRPVDEPASVLVQYDWWEVYDEALTRRPELRQERWELKKRELALSLARNGLLPQMDVVALYRWLGLGQKLAGGTSDSIDFPGTFANGVFSPAVGSRAYNQLGDGDYQEMSLSLQFGLPVGFRKELANVRNAQLKLAREHSRLEDMELDVQRELALVYRAKDTNYELAQDHANRWVASAEELRIQNALWKEGTVTIDRVLDARRRLAQSQIDYYRSLCEYNKSIALMHRRKGSTLDYCGVQFDEGPWPAKAYSDADELARRRSAARTINYGYSRPGVVSETMPNEHGDIIYMDGDVELMPGEYIEGGEPTPIDPAIPLPMPNGMDMTSTTLPNALPNRTSIPRMDLGVQQASFVEGNAAANLLPPAEAQPGSQHVPARLPLPNMNGGAVPTNSLRGASEMLSDQQPGAGYP